MNLRQILAYLIFGLIGALIGFIAGEILATGLFQIGELNAYGNDVVMGQMLTRVGSTLAIIGFVAGVALAWAKRQLH